MEFDPTIAEGPRTAREVGAGFDLVITEEHREQVRTLCVLPTLTSRMRTDDDRRDAAESVNTLSQWLREMVTDVSVLRRWLSDAPLRYGYLDDQLAKIRELQTGVSNALGNARGCSVDEVASVQRAVLNAYAACERIPSRLEQRFELLATARAAGLGAVWMNWTEGSKRGEHKVSAGEMTFTAATAEDVDAIVIAHITKLWAEQQRAVMVIGAEVDRIESLIDAASAGDLAERARWKKARQLLMQTHADLQTLRQGLDPEFLDTTEAQALKLHQMVMKLSGQRVDPETDPVQKSVAPVHKVGLVNSALTALIGSGMSGASVALGLVGFLSELPAAGIGAVGLALVGSGIGMLRSDLRPRTVPGEVITTPAALTASADPSLDWTQQLANDLVRARSGWAGQLPEELLAQVDAVIETLSPVLAGSAVAMSELDRVSLQKLAGQMLPTIVGDFLSLRLATQDKREQAQSNFTEMLSLIKADVLRLAEHGDESALRRQGDYRNYLRDALGVSELNLKKTITPDS